MLTEAQGYQTDRPINELYQIYKENSFSELKNTRIELAGNIV